MLDLAIIILNYNTRDLLAGCLASLRAQGGLEFVTCVVGSPNSPASWA